MKALFVLPYQFVPPDSGNKTLTFGLLKHLTEHISCDVAVLVDEGKYQPASIEASIRAAFPSIGQVRVFKKPLGWALRLARLRALARGWHPSLGSYFGADLQAWMKAQCAAGCYDLLHFDMFHTAMYRLDVEQVPAVLVASDAYSMAANKALTLSSGWASKFRLRVEAGLFLRMESRLYARFNAVCTVSEIDAAYLRTRTGNPRIRRIGIALSGPFLERQVAHFATMRQGMPRILITGSIDHGVVAEGVRAFLADVFPGLKAAYPDLEVVVLGKSPEAQLLADIHALSGVRHVSFVDDYAEFLDQDWVYVYPQRCGSGLQTKVQQAMALGLPVVGYDEAFGGLPISSGQHAFMCRDHVQMASSIRQLLDSAELRKGMGVAASAHIRHAFSIRKIGEEMLEIYRDVIPSVEV